jgi:hypothetical protein
MIYLSYYLLCFLFNKIREEEGGTNFAWKQWVGGVQEWGEGVGRKGRWLKQCKHI